jgi:hypothetical protein
MVDLTVSNELAEKLREIARRENRPLEAVLASMVEQYRAMVSSADEAITVPPDVQDKAVYRAAVREMRPKLYRLAREYWQRIGDKERLALTDEDLDEQFWLIDPQGVPRLKSDQGKVEIPADPLEDLIGLIDDAPPDLSMTVRETMAEHYRAKDQDGSSD